MKETGHLIIMIADCHSGVSIAGSFVARHLYGNEAQILLLQTYQLPSMVRSSNKDLSGMLTKVAEEELEGFRNLMTKEFDIPRGKVGTRVEEGYLTDVIQKEFSGRSNLSVAVGSQAGFYGEKVPCGSVVRALLESTARPLFLVAECIAIFKESGILTVVDEEDVVSGSYERNLKNLAENYRYKMEVVPHMKHANPIYYGNER